MQVASKSIYKPDRVLIRAIKIGGIPENDALKQLYKQNLTPVTSFVLRGSGFTQLKIPAGTVLILINRFTI